MTEGEREKGLGGPASQGEDKRAWGEGPWVDEPDHVEWRDEATGLPCIAHRAMHSGHWCGYVAVAPGHPLHRKDYSDVDVNVHGGLTYSGEECNGSVCHKAAPGEPDDVWWLGFDCGHSHDISPRREARDRERGWGLLREPYATYKPLGYVRAQCALLAQQLAAYPAIEGAAKGALRSLEP